jgi:hypothetical protein
MEHKVLKVPKVLQARMAWMVVVVVAGLLA